jgi:hypothetical protein
MKARKLFALLTISFLSTLTLFSQDYLIIADPPNNIYPITFTDINQQTLILEFTANITTAGTSAGWTITVGGTPVAMVGSPVSAGTKLRISLPSSISYANRNSVLLSYNNTLGTLTLTGGLLPNLVSVQAVNNYVAVAGDFSNGLSGAVPAPNICAPVVNVSVTYQMTVVQRYRNSVNYATPRYPIFFPRTQVIPLIAPGQ